MTAYGRLYCKSRFALASKILRGCQARLSRRPPDKRSRSVLHSRSVLQKQDTALDAALTVAHAVWHVAGALLGGRPKERVLTRSLHDLTPVREMS